MLVKALDIIGAMFQVGGAILIIYLNKWGFIAFVIGCLCLGSIAYRAQNWGTFLMYLVFIGLDIWGFVKW